MRQEILRDASVHDRMQRGIRSEVTATAYDETHPRPPRPEPEPEAPRQAPSSGGIVVGVDGSPASLVALEWAVAEAARRHCRLLIVQARIPAGHPAPHERSDERLHAQLRELGQSVLDRGELPEVAVGFHIGEPGPVLVANAEHADLLVVGSRGLGAVARTLLGSVSSYCAIHAPCPTVIVPPGAATGG